MRLLFVFAIAMSVALTEFWIQGSKGFDLWDDGYLWYGVQRVAHGEIPILDFMAYDPARYYLTVALMKIVSVDGLLGLRFVVTLIQGAAIYMALLLLYKTSKQKCFKDSIFIVGSSVIFALWMFPYYKIFDIAASIFVVYTITFLIESPTRKRYFISGVLLGVVGLVGKNHILYGVASAVMGAIWLKLDRRFPFGLEKALGLLFFGIIFGLSPLIIAVAINHEFGAAYFEGLIYLFKIKATNLSLPIPWPWKISLNDATPIGDVIRGGLVGIGFVLLPVFGVATLCWLLVCLMKNRPVPPAVASCGLLALPYAHYAFSRADVAHLALGIFPMLIGSLAAIINLKYKIKLILLFLIAAASIWVMHVYHPGWQCYAMINCTSVDISGSKIHVAPGTMQDIGLLRQLDVDYNYGGGAFLATPFWPGAYALLERKSPIWEIYALLPQSDEFQEKEVEQIKRSNVQFVVVIDIPLDGREDLRYKNSRSIVYDYIVNNYDPVSISQNMAYEIYKARSVD